MSRSSRPTSLPGLLLRAAALRRRSILGALATFTALVVALLRGDGCEPKTRLATFNIENYPRSAAQEQGAFEAIQALGAPVVALQEITDPTGFCSAARRRLGATWSCAFADRPQQRVGVVFDAGEISLLGTETHRETELYPDAKPAFEARFWPVFGVEELRVFVVHLKAGGDGGPMRIRQLAALEPVVTAAVKAGGRVAVLGDFNATGPGDVEAIGKFGRATGLRVASEEVPCTAYWDRRDGCLGVALDQVLTSFRAEVQAEGPCRTEGCELRPACPVFHGTVSDHCPVAVRF